MLRTRIIGTGSFLPPLRIDNSGFLAHRFYTADRVPNPKSNDVIVKKLTEISGIEERRYATDAMCTSDLAFFAAQDALTSSGIDGETLDYIIVAHNFGDVSAKTLQTSILPNIAARVKARLGIQNSNCVAYDILFGCPGWVQAFIQADYYLRSGDAKRIMIIGADVLSRVLDPHDVDSMLFGDGAGAIIAEGVESTEKMGILAHKTLTDSLDKCDYLTMGESRNAELGEHVFVKMQGPNVFKYGLENVPAAVAESLKKANIGVDEVSQFVVHQANERMIRAMAKRLAEMYGLEDLPEGKLPFTVQFLGNSSAATIPTLLDFMMKGKMKEHPIKENDVIVMASVGAGMHACCVVYKH